MAPPSEFKSVVITKPGTAEVKTVPLPALPDDYILVRATAVALNPTDWKHIDMPESMLALGARVGCDYAGVVEAVGPKVTKPFAKGDRIYGIVHGSNKVRPDSGAFGEYIIVKGDLQSRTPDNLTDQEAATLGVGVSTVGQGLYQALHLPLPGTPEAAAAAAASPRPEVLIYGGSTATGILGIQFAKLSGYRVVTTCSPSNFDYVKSLGADGVFDYRSPSVADDIRAWSADADALVLAWDCVSTPDSAKICAAALSRTRAGHHRSLLRIDEAVVKGVNDKVDTEPRLAYTMMGEPFEKWAKVPAIPADFEYGKMFWGVAAEVLAQGNVKPARVDLNRGGKGLEGVLVGLKELKENKVSGVKLVYDI